MTGFNSKRQAAQDKLDDDDAQVYIAEYEAALLVSYQSGFADGKRAASRAGQAEPVKPTGQLQECLYGRGQVLWFAKPADRSMLYTIPPAAQRKPLTATTIGNMMPSTIPMEHDGALMEFARAIEAAHNIKEET
jgi:hypothetical protein